MIPWHEGTALCLADLRWADGAPVVASPRQILRAQLERLAERGLEAFAGTELEFIVFKDTYEEAAEKGYRDLKPANHYNVDYSVLGTARVEPLLRRIRNEMGAAGLAVENSKGECNDGQHEINFHYGPALRTADEHAIYKTGAKEIAAQEGMAITFMAKYDEREGSSCHIHLSLRRDRRQRAVRRRPGGLRALRRRPARLPARADAVLRAQHQLLQALRGRLVRAHRGGVGPRQPHLRGARRRPRRRAAARAARAGRRRQPVPGAGGDDRRGPARARRASSSSSRRCEGNAYASDKPHVPATLRRGAPSCSRTAASRARPSATRSSRTTSTTPASSSTAFDAAVTDWERTRGFERL